MERITEHKLQGMLALYCEARGLDCDHPEDGGWKHPEERKVGGLSIDHAACYGGSMVAVRSAGGGEGETRVFGGTRRPRRDLYLMIRAAWLTVCEINAERDA